MPDPATRSLTVLETNTCPGAAFAATRAPIGVGGPEAPAFDLVAAREGLHLAALGLLIPEVDRAKGAPTADRAGRRVGLAHGATVHPGRPYVRLV